MRDTINDTVKKDLVRELNILIENKGALSKQIMKIIGIARPPFIRGLQTLKKAEPTDFIGALKTRKHILSDLAII